MAIDYIPYPDSDSLAHSEKGFYPVKIPVSHWQLRHYISTPEPDLLYYASGQDIYCLNTATKKRKHIAALPFEARCTASGYGWVCVGGDEDGHFASIKLDGSPQPQPRDVDTALPIDDHWRRSGVGRRAASIKVERMGEEIVNSISIHRIQNEEAHLDDIVAVLTNNDKTVRIYSLPAEQETRVKDLPFAMNHATISPDGRTLIAVGDYNQAYFFTREIVDTPPQIPKPHNRLTSASVEWTLTNVVTLYVSSPEATIGFFTTAWSQNGRMVAVGSEGGYIAVFDMEILTNPEYDDEDAVIATVPGSRADLPSPHPGAVRSMMFAPEPWDLLIWAEDQGRICIGDLRTGLKSRQVIPLEPKDETLMKFAFDDDSDEALPAPVRHDDIETYILRRARAAPDSASAMNAAAEWIEARRQRQQQRQDTGALRPLAGNGSRQTEEDDSQGLTAREQQVLETLRTARQREEARVTGELPRSINYTTPDLFTNSGSRSGASSSSTRQSSTRPMGDLLSSVQDSLPELSRTHAASPRPSSSHAPEASSPLRPSHALQDGVWGPARGSSTSGHSGASSRLGRQRQAAVVLDARSEERAGAATANVDSQASTPSQADPDDENPWRVIEEQMSAATRGQLLEVPSRAQASLPLAATESQVQADVQNELDTQQRIRIAQLQQRQRERWRGLRSIGVAAAAAMSAGSSNGGSSTADIPPSVLLEARRSAPFPDGYETLLRRTQMQALGRHEVGVRTAGLAMSSDGRTIWAACEEGIFEVKLRLKGRMFWPALEPR